MKRYTVLFIVVIMFIGIPVIGQDEWDVPITEKDNLSIFSFDKEFSLSGEIIYNNSCISCHGDPTQDNYSLMAPPPGDVASNQFQRQKDGELFYKIKKGRGSMPAFEDALSDEEIWNLVAYMRSFNKNYKQSLPNMEGIEIPVLELVLSYDGNIDKLVVHVKNDKDETIPEASVSAFVKGMFGNFLLGKSKTNERGIAYFNIDSKMPGDEEGKLEVVIKASKGYGTVKATKSLVMVDPVIKTSVIQGRHLWSTSKMAPVWLKAIFLLTMISVWGPIFYLIFGLRKIKKLQ